MAAETYTDPQTFEVVVVTASTPTVGIATGDASPSGNALLVTASAPAWNTAGYNAVSLWLQVYPSDVGGNETPLDLHPDGATAGTASGLSVNGGNVGLYASNVYNGTGQVLYFPLPQDGALHHVVWSFPLGSAASASNTQAWLDGRAMTPQGGGGTLTVGSYLLLGGIGPAGTSDQGAHFDGWQAELFLFARALTQTDVDALYAGQSVTGAIAAYPMNEGSGNVLHDTVAGNNLTLAEGTALGWWKGSI